MGFDVLLCCNVVGFGVFLGECMACFCNMIAFLCIVVLCFWVGYRVDWCFVGFCVVLGCIVTGKQIGRAHV